MSRLALMFKLIHIGMMNGSHMMSTDTATTGLTLMKTATLSLRLLTTGTRKGNGTTALLLTTPASDT